MIFYSFDPNTFRFNGTFEYEPIIGLGDPVNSTRVEIPTLVEPNQHAFWNGSEWYVDYDYTGRTVFDIETKEQSIVSYIGEIKDGFTLLVPKHKDDLFIDGKWEDCRTESERLKDWRNSLKPMTMLDFELKTLELGYYHDIKNFVKNSGNTILEIKYNRNYVIFRNDDFLEEIIKKLGIPDGDIDSLWC